MPYRIIGIGNREWEIHFYLLLNLSLKLMKTTLLVLLFLFVQTIQQTIDLETDTFLMWEILDLQQAENTGFVYQDCDFLNLLLEAVKLGIIRPYMNDSLQTRLSQQTFLERINQNTISNKTILKSNVEFEFDEIIDNVDKKNSNKKLLAISIYSTKGNLICAFSYKELTENLFSENSEAMICLGEDLKIPLIEIFDNYSFKTEFLRRIKIE